MVGPSEFRIVNCRYFNEKAEVTIEHWSVQQWTKGLLGYSWKTIGGQRYSSGGSYFVPAEFKSLEDARACLERIKNKTPRNEWITEPV